MLQAEEYHNLYCHPTGKIWNFRYFLLHSHLFTDIVQTTAVTIRFCPRRTYFTSMIHKTVTQIIPFLRRNDLPECHLYFFGFFDSIDKTNTVCKADTVCVSYECRFSKYLSHDQLRTLSSHTRKLEKGGKIFRHITPQLLT